MLMLMLMLMLMVIRHGDHVPGLSAQMHWNTQEAVCFGPGEV
jgi:hypothetical protein